MSMFAGAAWSCPPTPAPDPDGVRMGVRRFLLQFPFGLGKNPSKENVRPTMAGSVQGGQRAMGRHSCVMKTSHAAAGKELSGISHVSRERFPPTA
jgi:hypothetical protein